MPSRLSREMSPYLLAHTDQPIDWYPWGQEPFDRARREDKPLLISIGYLSCYWCHVMAHETFDDAAIGVELNRDFVCIKIDREERPDVDRLVLDGLARLGARTGWPVNAFMTPDAVVFAGGSYYPPTRMHGLPAFRDVVSESLARYRAGVRHDAPASRAAPAKGASRARSATEDVALYGDYLARRVYETVDPIYGGFGQSGPKFPQPMLHELLWRTYADRAEPAFRDAAVGSIRAICRSALFDHVGGGFHRYCVDDAWTEPHVEKMLYDNAQLLDLLAWLYRGTGAPLFAARAEATVAWLVREMRVSTGGFASSLGAFADGSDGASNAFHLWEVGEIRALLGDDANGFFRRYRVGPSGALAEIDRGSTVMAAPDEWQPCLTRLLETREARAKPRRDDKVLADWNGLAIAALVEAGFAFGHPEWIGLAGDTFDELVPLLEDGDRLRHCLMDGRPGVEGLLDDHAAMSRAALRLFEATGEARYLRRAETWVAMLNDRFWDNDAGGYFASAADAWRPGARLKTITETTVPPGNGLMIGVLTRLHELTGLADHRMRAELLVAAFQTDIVTFGPAAATAVNNTLSLHQFIRIEVSGPADGPDAAELLRIARACCAPDRMALWRPGDGSARAQVCVGPTCLLPTRDADALRRLTEPGGLRQQEDVALAASS